MGTYPVVLLPPDLRLDLGLGKRVKDLHVQKFIPELGVEALDKPVLPRFPRLDVDGIRAFCGKPFFECLLDELWAIVAA